MRGRPVPLIVELKHPRHDLDGNDRGGDPVDDEAERRPLPSVRNELTSVLPEILEPVPARPRTSSHGDLRDGRGSDLDEIAATSVSTAITTQRPSATAKPM